MSAQPIASRQEAEAVLRAKAAADPKFRSELLANPSEAVGRALGVTFPKGVTLTVLEETDKQIYLVLPPPASDELSDDQLSTVAGGMSAVQSIPPGGGQWGKGQAVDPGSDITNPANQAPFQGG
jgi:hypothetical protein